MHRTERVEPPQNPGPARAAAVVVGLSSAVIGCGVHVTVAATVSYASWIGKAFIK